MLEEIVLFFKENDNIIEYFYNQKITLSEISRSNIKEITKKTSNNLIGYYQFKEKDIYYKIYILPKIYQKKDDDTNKNYFFSFIKNYYELKIEFPQIDPKSLNSNIVDLALDSNSLTNEVNDMDALIKLKYIDALKTIIKFFKRHNKSTSKLISYTSQSVKHKINLGNNIRELDKSKIHQDKCISVLYSKLSFIAINSLSFFLKYRVSSVMYDNKEIKQFAHQAKNIINKKFVADRSFSFKTKEITKDRINSLFRKNNEYRKLYNALITILGVEYYSSGANNKETTKINNMTALYFDPALLYEWYVYKELQIAGKYFPNMNNYSIRFDKVPPGTSLNYLITNDTGYNSKRSSNPDFILENDTDIVIIDVKWKIFDNESDESNGLKIEDIIKLHRDVEIRKNTEFIIQAVLIYPKISENFKDQIFTVNYPSTNNIFNFKVIEVQY